MTTIVATHSSNYAAMLADQGITGDLMHPDMHKVVRQGTWLIGVSGEDRVCDIVQYAVVFPKIPQSLVGKPIEKWYPWVVKQVIPKIGAAVDNNLAKSYRGTLGESQALLMTHGHSFLLSEGLGLTKAEPYWAVGSGSHLAMGHLAGAIKDYEDWEWTHYEVANEAVKTAQTHDPYTRGKISGFQSFPDGRVMPLKLS